MWIVSNRHIKNTFHANCIKFLYRNKFQETGYKKIKCYMQSSFRNKL